MKASHSLFLIAFLSCLVCHAQLPTSSKLSGSLKKKYHSAMVGIDVSYEVQQSIDSLIDVAVKDYDAKPSETRKEQIIDNFDVFLKELKKAKTGSVGSGENYKIEATQFQSSMSKVCPLYPFC